MKKYVKFIGKFGELKKDGWKFCKLFARNYRQYSKTCDGSEYGQRCRIWQHLGGYLEIGDIFNASATIVEQIAAGKIQEWEHLSRCIWASHEMESHYWLLINRENNTIISQMSLEGISIKQEEYDICKIRPSKKRDKLIQAYHNKYRTFVLRVETIRMIQDLLDRKLIVVTEDKRKA